MLNQRMWCSAQVKKNEKHLLLQQLHLLLKLDLLEHGLLGALLFELGLLLGLHLLELGACAVDLRQLLLQAVICEGARASRRDVRVSEPVQACRYLSTLAWSRTTARMRHMDGGADRVAV